MSGSEHSKMPGTLWPLRWMAMRFDDQDWAATPPPISMVSASGSHLPGGKKKTLVLSMKPTKSRSKPHRRDFERGPARTRRSCGIGVAGTGYWRRRDHLRPSRSTHRARGRATETSTAASPTMVSSRRRRINAATKDRLDVFYNRRVASMMEVVCYRYRCCCRCRHQYRNYRFGYGRRCYD